MRIINLIVSSLILIFLLFCHIKSYYSPHRLIKGIFTYLKNTKYKIYVILFMYSICNLFYFSYIFVCLSYIFYLIFIITFPKEIFKLRSRGYRLLTLALLINGSIIFLEVKYSLVLLIIYPLISLILAHYFLLPIESIINNYYLKKAKEKIKRINPIVIGITGSFSKTTFKMYLSHILKAKYICLYSPGNINTLMGLTKWINNDLSNLCEVLVLEMGIDKYHGIKKFKKLISLDIGVLTSVGKMHISTFKTYERLLISKCEIDDLLKPQGTLFINERYNDIKKYDFKSNITFYGNNTYDEKFNKFQNEAIDGALKIGKYLFINNEEMIERIKTLPNVNRRFEIKENEDMIVINDSYNINFEGVKEAIRFIEKYKRTSVVITGGLIELGKYFYEENYKLGELFKNVDYLYLFSKDINHPIKKAYEKISNKNCILISSFKDIKNEIKNISDKKIVLITAIKGDFFIE